MLHHATQRIVVADDRMVLIVQKQFPLLSEDSWFALRTALAAAREGKHFEAHSVLRQARGMLTADRVAFIVSDLKLDSQRKRGADTQSRCEFRSHGR